jgi:hypothetical protein
MAKGPKCADEAQRYILQAMKTVESAETYGEIVDTDQSYDGAEEWSIGSVFNGENLEMFGEGFEIDEKGDRMLRRLDEAYNVVRNTNAGPVSYSKLDGLKAFSDDYDAEMPTDNRKTRNNWVSDYIDAGLVDLEVSKSGLKPQEEGTLTEAGEMMIETTERLDEIVFEDLEMDAGDAYRVLGTQGHSSGKQDTGGKVEAFFLYGAGMNHSEVSRQTGTPSSTVRSMAETMEDQGLFTESYMWSPEGRDFADMMLQQMDQV